MGLTGVRANQSAGASGLSRANQSLVNEIKDANKRGKTGTFSARFTLAGTRKELTPQEAVGAMSVGLKVSATLVTFKTYRGGKIVRFEKKVRVKVRGVDAKEFKNVEQFEKWFDKQKAAAAEPKKPTRTRSVHPTKRG